MDGWMDGREGGGKCTWLFSILNIEDLFGVGRLVWCGMEGRGFVMVIIIILCAPWNEFPSNNFGTVGVGDVDSKPHFYMMLEATNAWSALQFFKKKKEASHDCSCPSSSGG